MNFLLCIALGSEPAAATAPATQPAAAHPLKVSVEYDKKADFSRYQTYSWQPGLALDNQSLDQRLTEAVEKELTAKGWRKLDTKDTTKPDARISYSVSGKRQSDPSRTGRPTWATDSQGARALRLSTGSLVFDVLDGANGKSVWTGIASGLIGDKANSAENAIDLAVKDLFKDFPPSN